MIDNTDLLIEHLDHLALHEYEGEFAIADTTAMSALIESDNPIFKVANENVLFGYTKPISGVIFRKLTKDQACAWFDNPPAPIEENVEDDGACEIYELSPNQFDKLQQISKGMPLPVDPDVNWLAEAGLVQILASGNPQATSLGKQWAGMSATP